MNGNTPSSRLIEISSRAAAVLAERFADIERVSEENTARILEAFKKARVSDSYFAGTLGYGYGDKGREGLDAVYADVFGAQDALVRIGFVNGTHAIKTALFAALSPGQTLLSVTGEPYDTLRSTIGGSGDDFGSLRYFGMDYAQIDLMENGCADLQRITEAVSNPKVGAVFIQRSRGYSLRRALTVSEIGEIIGVVKGVNPGCTVVVDNCYGEFVENMEPTHVGADLIAGSMIKNPGGGLAPTGGYIAGSERLVKRAAEVFTAPGIGGECGATMDSMRLLYQGFFMAPHAVSQALKTAVFCSYVFNELGYIVTPGPFEIRSDIIQIVELGSPERLIKFCRGIQAASPVDSFLTPEPWRMPGYDCDVIMAAGTFVQGSTIELSADAPMREPFCVFLQGGLTYESGKLSIISAASEMLD